MGTESGEELCLYGYGVTSKFKLKSLVVMDASGCAVQIPYGECVLTYDGKTYREKVYWYSNADSSYRPNPCFLEPDSRHLVDSVCDGITFKKGGMSGYDYGTKFWRSLFACTDNAACDDPGDERNLRFVDIAGAMSKCAISATFPPAKAPFNYLNFCYGAPESPAKRSAYICAPKTLCGPFLSYCLNQSGQTSSYPDLELIHVNPDLSIECGQFPAREGFVPSYDFACISACVTCRLNTELTACANLLDPVCDDGNDHRGWLYLPE